MLPDVAALHRRNQTPANPKITSNSSSYLALGASLSNLSNQIICELRHPTPVPASRNERVELGIKAVLGDAIPNVVLLGPSEEMSRVDTAPYVAGMEHVGFVVGNLAVGDQIRNAVRPFGVIRGDAELTIPTFDAGSRPQPANIRPTAAVNLLPESLKLSRGKLHTHRVLLTLGAMPGVVTAMPRLSVLSSPLYQIGGAR